MFPASSSRNNRSTKALLQRPDVARLLAALNCAGEEARIVGGAVRDALMRHPAGDIDVATTLLPEDVMAIARREGWKVVPTGLAHGTVTIIINRTPYEVTTLRRDVETDGRRAVVAFTRDFAEDAFRRDFTINALSLAPDGTVHDYATGLADAQAGLVRFMGDAETRIAEDYLRILRFFRFHASHGAGDLDETSLMACGHLKAGMTRLSRERIRQELLKLLAAKGAVDVLRRMDMLGFSTVILPGVEWDIGALQHFAHLETRLKRPPDAILRLSALAGAAVDLQDALKLSNHDQARITAANAFSREACQVLQDSSAIRSLVFRAGPDAFQDALMLDAARSRLSTKTLLACLRTAATVLSDPPVNPFSSADVAALGIAPGPRMGRILKMAGDLWLAEGLPDDPPRHAAMLRQAMQTTAD